VRLRAFVKHVPMSCLEALETPCHLWDVAHRERTFCQWRQGEQPGGLTASVRRRYAVSMRKLLFGVLGSALLATACSTLSPGSPGRPRSTSDMQTTQRDQPKDPHDFVADPTIGSAPPTTRTEKPLCKLQCGPNTHCDNSGFVERCVSNEEKKP
jgi:hypothetical protein